MKTHSTFFNDGIISLIRDNLKTNKVAAKTAAEFIRDTSYWMNLSYDELKSLMFSPALKRSWFVRSDGSCPACGNSVPMYNWQYDPMEYPWKMKCPHCSELFPKNDFKVFYDSGLDDNGVFRHEIADRSLLVNEEGTGLGVDDGNGWHDDNGHRYMFIGAYLVHAQWRKNIVPAIFNLSFAYILTGNPEYARRSAVLLDSVAEFFSDFDFFEQGYMYEKINRANGYVSYWANSCTEVRSLALAYDQIFKVIRKDTGLEAVLGKDSSAVCKGIENNILKDALNNVHKINSNPPATPSTIVIIKSVLDYENNKNEILSDIDDIITKATFVDGLSGEKGLAGYAAMAPRSIANLICLYSNTDDGFIDYILKKHPVLYKTYHFHINTWYDAKYYPGVGDNSIFAHPTDTYISLFPRHAPLNIIYYRSREWFAMKLSEYYGDPDFAKVIYISNGNSSQGCFSNDLYIGSPDEYENRLLDIIDNSGSGLRQESMIYKQWRLSVLHMGEDENKVMLAMPYDSGANHCHHDALSLHLFSKGLNMTADFGYPPVNRGGWQTKEVAWYRHPASHNMVVIDGKAHTNLPKHVDGNFYLYPEHGKNMMLADGSFVKAVYNDAKEYADVKRYERLSALVDMGGGNSYCLDISRTDGGKEHARFQRSTYSTVSSEGLETNPSGDYYPDRTFMRNFMTDENPSPGWNVDFTLIDEYRVLPYERDLHLKYTSLTPDASAALCESWVDVTRMVQTSNIRTGNQSVWIPTLIERKTGPRTQFTGILEPYEGISKIKAIIRPNAILNGDFDEAIEVIHADGTKDLIIANDPESNQSIYIPRSSIMTDALLTVARFKDDKLIKVIICSGTFLTLKDARYTPGDLPDIIEFL